MMTEFLKSTVRPWPSGDAAVVEHLEQHVEDLVMRLFDLVERNDRIRLAAHGFRKLAAFLEADITGRCADQPGGRCVSPCISLMSMRTMACSSSKRNYGKRFAQLGFADPRWGRGR